MSTKRDKHSSRARGPDSPGAYITTVFLIALALLAGLVYFIGPAGAVSTIHILDNQTGGDCIGMGWEWSPETRTCTMTTDLTIEGADAIHIESDRVTLDGRGHAITGNGSGNGVTVSGTIVDLIDNVSVNNLRIARFSVGIMASYSSRTMLSGVEARESSMGVYLGHTIDSTVTGGTFTDCGNGINISNSSVGNTVTWNTLTGNSDGIFLATTGANIFTYNTITGSINRGICVVSSSGSSFYYNMLTGNATQAAVFGGANSFDGGPSTGGNYWSNWTSPDANGDGLVDNPYVFSGGQDNYPLTSSTGWERTAPVISNVLPAGAVRTGLPTITAAYTDPEPSLGVNIASVTANFTSGSYPSALACTATGTPSGTISCTPADTLVSGHYDFDVHITDSKGNVGTGTGSFDVTPYHITDTTGGGDCTAIGIWDAGSKTCTLTADLAMGKMDGIHIESDNVTLDGNGHTLAGQPTGLANTSGVTISSRSGVTVRNLHLTGFLHEFYLDSASGCTLTDNTATSSGYQNAGFKLRLTSACSLIGNSLSGFGRGIDMVEYSSGNTITGNVISGNWEGIAIGQANTFTDNIFSGNHTGFMTTPGGIGSGSSTLYHNSFINNTLQTDNHAGFYSNIFDGGASEGGNYWSDYDTPAEGCNDLNGDGFCDAPYVTPGSGTDNYPFTAQYGWDDTPPVITNVQPSGTIHNGAFTVTADYVDPEPASSIVLSSATAHFTSGPTPFPTLSCVASGTPAGTITCTPDTGLEIGNYGFEISITDGGGNTTTAAQSFDIYPYRIRDEQDGHDCEAIGTWDAGTKTCTLDTDITLANIDAIWIESKDITLDGDGHTLASTSTPANGVRINGAESEDTRVTVRNLNFNNFTNGIILYRCNSCSILGNTVYAGGDCISVSNSSDVDIIGNSVTDGNIGLVVFQSVIVVSGNQFHDNNMGMWLLDTDNSAITANIVTNSPVAAYALTTGSDNNVFRGNLADSNAMALDFRGGSGSLIEGNTITANTNYGFYISEGASGNTFRGNSFSSNFRGINISGASGNWVYNNRFLNNSIDAEDVGGGNFFNGSGSEGGNYWDDYDTPGEGCSDSNLNGFCDAPRTIIGAGSQDAYPWVAQYGWDIVGPVVSNIQPAGWINTTSTTISADYADAGSTVNAGSVTVSVDGNPVPSGDCTANSVYVSCTKAGLSLGQHSISVTVGDAAGNTGTGTGTFGVDSSPFHIESPFIEKWTALGGAPGAASDVAMTIGGGKYQEFSNGILVWNESTGLVYWVHGAIQTKYDEHGGIYGVMGLPVSDEMNVAGVTGARESDFTGGRIYWGPGIGTSGVHDAIVTRYLAGGGSAVYGIPTSDEYVVGAGKAQNMQKAILTWDGTSNPARTVVGSFLVKYIAMGGPTGSLGLAVSDEIDVSGVTGARESDFFGGRIYWGPGIGTYSVMWGPIASKYLFSGGPAVYGIPTSDKFIAGAGEAQNMQKATLTWDGNGHPAYAVVGGILGKYKALGGPTGTLGLATGDEGNVAGVTGARESRFTGGRIFWGPGVGTFAMTDMNILTHFDSNGGASYLGLPTSDVYNAWDGKAQNMQKAIFTWNPRNGAHYVRGGVMVKYQMTGGPAGYLHLIISEEAALNPALPTHPEAVQAIFENGRVYWSLTTGSHIVNGGVYVTYMGYCDAGTSNCGPRSRLGLPITDEYPLALPGGGARSRFEHGFISWWIYYGSWVDVT